MGESENKSPFWLYFVIAGAIFLLFAILAIPNFVRAQGLLQPTLDQ
jgi:hypothetical protein